MKRLIGTWLCTAVVLAGCGGGGGDGNTNSSQPFTPAVPRIDIIPQQASLPANTSQFPPETLSPYLTPVNIRVLYPDGTAVPEGVIVSLRTQDPRTVSITSQTGNSFFALSDSFCAQTSGGIASFAINSGPQAGTVQLTASVMWPPEPGTVSDDEATGTRTCRIPFREGVSNSHFGTLNFQVTPGPAPFERLTLAPGRTTLAVNAGNLPVTPTSPFVTPVDITFRTLRGDLVPTGRASIAISPPIGRFSLPDDPATPANEFNTLFLNGSVPIINGRATIYVHSTAQPGTFSLSAIAADPQSGAQITRELTFNSTGTQTGLPSRVLISQDNRPLYVRGTNGENDMPLQVLVTDASNLPVPDSTAANVLLEILPVANGSGEVLAAQGVPDASSVRLRTIGGAAQATFRSGTRQGVVTVRATVDRADNNIDNGIQNAVVSQTSFIVSDGKLFDMEITSPTVRAIIINGVDPTAVATPLTGTTVTVPPDPDGSYAVTVSVVATDRQGQPVLANTPIEFGLIDSPLVGGTGPDARDFAIQGSDGDPQEGGSTFTAVSGRFTTAGGGAGPGDTLIVFGEDSPGNRDLESARTIARVNSSNSLTIQNRFNWNDDTGASVNNGPVLDYVIGRATTGNIGPTALTRADGVASVRMTYPVSQLGRLVVVWARGSGDVVGNSAEIVTDAELFRFPGVAPGLLTASPGAIPANITSSVQVCYTDALGAGIQGVRPGFAVQGSATTTVDGVAGSGFSQFPTGSNGCTSVSINASGVIGEGTTITFAVGSATAVVTVTPPNSATLQAIPASLGGGGGTVRLRLLDGNGNPIGGILIVGECTGGGDTPITLFQSPGVTNAQGETIAGVSASLNGIGSAGSGSCTFTAVNGPNVVVPLQGVDICETQFSPLCPNQQVPQSSLVVQADGPADSGSVSGNAGGLYVVAPGQQSVQVDYGTVVQLTALPGAGFQFCGWSGAAECAIQSNVVQVPLNQIGTKTCIARFRPTPGACSP